MNMLEILSGMCYSEKDSGNSPVSIGRYFKGTSRFTKGTLQAIHLKPRKHGTARETIQAREPLLLVPLVSGKEAGYNKNGEQMENTQKNNGRLRAREKLLERVKNFTLLSDVFLSVALRDKAACQHVLRLLTGKEKLTVNIWKREKNTGSLRKYILSTSARPTSGRMAKQYIRWENILVRKRFPMTTGCMFFILTPRWMTVQRRLLGKTEEAQKTVFNMSAKGFGIDMIAELTEVSAETVRTWLAQERRVPG